MSASRRVLAIILAALFILASAEQAFGAATLKQDSLGPVTSTPEAPFTATLRVHSSACTHVQALGVAVRDAQGNNLDFPGSTGPVVICPTGFKLTTAARSFRAGTYTMFGFYRDAAGYHNFPSKNLTVGQAPGTTPGTGKTPYWSEEFNHPLAWGCRWTGNTTSAYQYGNHNPADDKLDWLNPANVKVANGVATFTARPSSHILENGRQAWDTGLLTTEGSTEGFQIRTGDYVETRVQLPTSIGAWPALWTWKNGNNEIDTFEYHVDNPNLLELTDHINSNQLYWTNTHAVQPGKWITIGVYYGASSHDWYVNGTKIFADRKPAPSGFSAYLILNLSIVAGTYHPAPTSTDPITFAADYIRVYR
jgi:hypothetical protein